MIWPWWTKMEKSTYVCISTGTLVEDVSKYSFLRCMLSLETLETPVQWTMFSFWIFLFCDNSSKHNDIMTCFSILWQQLQTQWYNDLFFYSVTQKHNDIVNCCASWLSSSLTLVLIKALQTDVYSLYCRRKYDVRYLSLFHFVCLCCSVSDIPDICHFFYTN